MTEAPRLDAQHPWPGLGAFTEADRSWFRGREAEADELARMVRRERLTVLFGRSGLGKSSLLNAGLFPRLREDLHLPVYLRMGYGAASSPRQQVWEALAAVCVAGGIDAPPPTGTESLWEFFHRGGAGFWNRRRRPLMPVLVFDQFEEVFTLGQANEAARAAAEVFVDELADLVEDRPSEALRRMLDADPARGESLDFERRGCKVVLSFREDFLAEVEGLRRRMPSVMRNRFRLLPMNGTQARAVIASGGDLVGPEIAERIVGLAWRNRAQPPLPEEADAIEVDPALLSVICSELNLRRHRAGAAHFEPGLLHGAETEILADFYERSLQPHHPRLREFVEDELITAAGYRDSFAFEDALARPGITRAALDSLISGRLLRVDERFGVRRLELTHDVLTRVVKDSRDVRRAREAELAAQERERKAMVLQRRNHVRALVSTAAVVLASALFVWAWWTVRSANEEALSASARAQRASDEAGRLVAASRQQLAELSDRAVVIAAGAAAAESKAQAAEARASEATARAQQLAGRADQILRDSLATDLVVRARTAPPAEPALQLLLGAELAMRYPQRMDGQVEQLARLVGLQRVRHMLDLGSPWAASVTVGSGRRVLVVTENTDIVLVDVVRVQELGRWRLGQAYVNSITASEDGRTITFGNYDGMFVARLEPGAKAVVQTFGPRRGRSLSALSHDGRWVARRSEESTVELYSVADLSRAPVATVLPLPLAIDAQCMAFSADASTLVVAGRDGSVSFDMATRTATASTFAPRAMARSRDCTWAAVQREAANGERHIALVNAISGRDLATLRRFDRGDPAGAAASVAFDTEGRYVALRAGATREVWALGAPTRRHTQPASDSTRAWVFSADGGWTVQRHGGNELELVRAGQEGRAAQFALPQAAVALHMAGDGSTLLAISQRGLVQGIHLEPDGPLEFEGQHYRASQIEFGGGGRYLGASSQGGPLALWETQSRRLVRLPDGATTVEFGSEGTLMMARGWKAEPRVTVHRLTAGLPRVAAFDFHGVADIGAMATGASGHWAAVATSDRIAIRRVGPVPGTAAIDLGSRRAVQLALHPLQARLAAVLDDGSVRVYELPAGRELWRDPRQGRAEAERTRTVAYSPAGTHLVAGRSDGAIIMHDPDTGRALRKLRPPRRSAEGVTNLVFVGDDESIVAAGELDGAKDLWDLRNRSLLGTVGTMEDLNELLAGRQRQGDLRAVALSPGERRVALRHADGTVSLRRWRPEDLIRDACAIAGRNLHEDEWKAAFANEPFRATCKDLPPAPLAHPR